MSKAINAEKLNKSLERFNALKRAVKIISYDNDPVMITLYSSLRGAANFSTNGSNDGFLPILEIMLHDEKDAIRKKYGIDVK